MACGGALAGGEAGRRWGGHGRVQQGRAEWGRSAVQRRGACARLAASSGMPAVAWLENRCGNNGNVKEQGEHQLEEVTYSRFEPLGKGNGGLMMEFHGDERILLFTGGFVSLGKLFRRGIWPARWGILGRSLWGCCLCEESNSGGLCEEFWRRGRARA